MIDSVELFWLPFSRFFRLSEIEEACPNSLRTVTFTVLLKTGICLTASELQAIFVEISETSFKESSD